MKRAFTLAPVAIILALAWPSAGRESELSVVPQGPSALALSDWAMSPAATRGRAVYARWCIGCHGEQGLGDGKASARLSPLPRNFQKGFFKFRSTPSGALPTEADLMRTITNGLPGSSMPSFELVPELQRRDAVAYVQYLAGYGIAKLEAEVLRDTEKLSAEAIRATRLPQLRAVVAQSFAKAQALAVPPEPAMTAESATRGAERYQRECAACHGKGGVGDGSASETLRDWQGAIIRPRDFTSGVFRAGSTNADLFLRMKTGLNGTPMPSVTGSDQDLWDLAHHIRSLVTAPAATPAKELK